MQHKLPTVEDALLDLSISLHSRIGQNEYSLYAFPGKRKQVEQLMDWTPQMKDIHTIFPKLSVLEELPQQDLRLKEAIDAYQKKRSKRGMLEDDGTSKNQAVNVPHGTRIRGKWNKESYQVIKKLGNGALGTVYLADSRKRTCCC